MLTSSFGTDSGWFTRFHQSSYYQ